VRLNQFLAAAGLGSRRGCETIIRDGRVALNGQRCTTLATNVQPGDQVTVDGRPVHAEANVYLLLHKPPGYVTTASDERGRRTVFDLLPSGLPRLFHVGRLDMESEGLLLLTNDGALAQRLTHPRHEIEKEYEVTLDRVFHPNDKARLLKGVFIPVEAGGPPQDSRRPGAEGREKNAARPTPDPAFPDRRGKAGAGRAASAPPAAVRHVRARAVAVAPLGLRTVRVILRQGFKRQLRLMFFEVGYEVKTLRRIRLGPLLLGTLRAGESRELTARELVALRGETPPARKAPPAAARPARAR